MEGWLDGDGTGAASPTAVRLYSLDRDRRRTGAALQRRRRRSGPTGGRRSTGGFANNLRLRGRCLRDRRHARSAEFVLYDRKLSDVERQQVEAYLRQKWITPGAALTLGPSDGLADTVATSDAAELGFQWAMSASGTPSRSPSRSGSRWRSPSRTASTSRTTRRSSGPRTSSTSTRWSRPPTSSGRRSARTSSPATRTRSSAPSRRATRSSAPTGSARRRGSSRSVRIAPALTIRNLAAEPAGLELGGSGCALRRAEARDPRRRDVPRRDTPRASR